jgi:protein-S-isoprenylcysteine O-methyltransferase Ste14
MNGPADGTRGPSGAPQGSAPGSTGGDSLPSLGRHGEGWVAIQLVLFLAEAACGVRGPRWPRGASSLRLATALALLAAGLALFADGSMRLGHLLTPFPRPVAGGEVRRTGAYGLVRHPLYGGVFMVSFAWALLSSPAALLPAALTLPFFELKRRREEVWLREEYEDYEAYGREVRHGFIPFVW